MSLKIEEVWVPKIESTYDWISFYRKNDPKQLRNFFRFKSTHDSPILDFEWAMWEELKCCNEHCDKKRWFPENLCWKCHRIALKEKSVLKVKEEIKTEESKEEKEVKTEGSEEEKEVKTEEEKEENYYTFDKQLKAQGIRFDDWWWSHFPEEEKIYMEKALQVQISYMSNFSKF